MKKRLVFFILLVSTLVVAQNDKIIDNDSIISWDKNRKLQWDDFKATKDPDRYGLNDAMTTYKLEIIPETVQVDEQNKIQVYEKMDIATYFFKKKSWTVKTDSLLLAHEQLHFDIAELYARKIRKEFSTLKKNKISNFNAYQTAYTRLWKSCRMYQKDYDDETNHGKDKDLNQKWIKKINKELEVLTEYALD